MSYEMELIHRIYSGDGFTYEIRPDPDGLGNIELRYFEDDDDDKEPRQSICLTEKSISLIIQALEVQLKQIRSNSR